MKSYAGYVRVSAVGGRGGDSFHSPEDQAAEIRAFAKARGLAVEILPAELDESGGRLDRPMLLAAVKGIESGRYAGLIVYDLSRYFRDTRGDLETTERVEAAGGQVLSTTEHFEPGALGTFLRTIVVSSNQLYRQQAAERFERYRRSSVERGVWKFRQVPLGYQLAGERPCGLVPSADAQKVRAAFSARLTSPPTPLQTIANRIGMTASGTRALLRNRVYLGEIKVGPHVNRGAHEAIVDRETFEAVQAAAKVRPAAGSAPGALLAGLARCGGCGHVMALNRSGARGGTYMCKADHSAGRCEARAGIAAPKVEQYVEQLARAELLALDFQTSRKSGETQRLRDELLASQEELAAYLAGTAAAGLPIESYAAGARERQDAIDAAQGALDRHHTLAPLGGLFADGAQFWDDLDLHERNRLLRGLLDAVVIRAVGRGRNVVVGERVRVFAHGTLGDLRYTGAGVAMPVRPMPFPGRDDERLIGVTGRKDRFGGAGG